MSHELHDPQQYDELILQTAAYVCNFKIAEDSDAIPVARLAFLDALGCAAETLQSYACPNFLGPYFPGQVNKNGFRLPGTAFELDPLKGAFDLSTLIRYLDHNDGIIGAEWGHPSGEIYRPCLLYQSSHVDHLYKDNVGSILAVADWIGRNPSQATPRSPPMNIHTCLLYTSPSPRD